MSWPEVELPVRWEIGIIRGGASDAEFGDKNAEGAKVTQRTQKKTEEKK
jgi:hypothetical protein